MSSRFDLVYSGLFQSYIELKAKQGLLEQHQVQKLRDSVKGYANEYPFSSDSFMLYRVSKHASKQYFEKISELEHKTPM